MERAEVKSLVVVFVVYICMFTFNSLSGNSYDHTGLNSEDFINPKVVNVPILECNGEQVSTENIQNIFQEDFKK